MAKLRLNVKERERLEVLSKVQKGRINLAKAAELLRVSYRQVLRIWQRFAADGNLGLKHGLRDRASNRQFDSKRQARVLELYQAKYGDFGPTLAIEYLRKMDGEDLSKETLRGWLIGAGLWQPHRRSSGHRASPKLWAPRMARAPGALGRVGPDGWLGARLVRRPSGQGVANGTDRRRHELDAREVF